MRTVADIFMDIREAVTALWEELAQLSTSQKEPPIHNKVRGKWFLRS